MSSEHLTAMVSTSLDLEWTNKNNTVLSIHGACTQYCVREDYVSVELMGTGKLFKAATRHFNFMLILAVPVDKSNMSTTASFKTDIGLASMCICFESKWKKETKISSVIFFFFKHSSL